VVFPCPVKFSQVIGWEDYTLVIYFVSESFPYKDQIEELFTVMLC